MAKQDLYKTAQQSAKLFKLIREGEEMEGWVSSKITRAAADIESVYQYLNFEKHFKEQERAINNNESLSEATKAELRAKLAEAKDKVAKMKKKAAKEKDEKMDESKGSTSGLDKTKGKVAKSEKSNYFAKSTHGNVTKGSRHQAGEGESDEDLKNRVERDITTKGGKMDSWRKVDEGKKCCCETKGKPKCPVHGKMDEGKKSKPDFLDLDKDGNKKEPMKKAAKDKKLDERDIGKHNNGKTTGFKAVAKKAAKEYGSKEAGERVAGAVKAKMVKAGKLEEGSKANIRNAIARAQAILEAKGKKPAKKADKDYDGDGKVESPKDEVWGSRAKAAAKAGHPFKESINESAELDRLKYLTTVVLKG